MNAKADEMVIPVSALWKTPLGWILILGLMSFLGMGGAGIMAGNTKGEDIKINVRENTVKVERLEKDIDEIKELCKDINLKLDRMRSAK